MLSPHTLRTASLASEIRTFVNFVQESLLDTWRGAGDWVDRLSESPLLVIAVIAAGALVVYTSVYRRPR